MSPILTIIGVTDARVGTIRIKRGSTGEAVGFKLEDTGTGLNGLALTHSPPVPLSPGRSGAQWAVYTSHVIATTGMLTCHATCHAANRSGGPPSLRQAAPALW